MPTADILSWDSNTDGGLVTSDSSYDCGQGGVSSNGRDCAQFYLSMPPLSAQNVSASVGKGVDQTFVNAVDLNPRETSNRSYTSKLYAEQYHTLTNSYPLNACMYQP